MLARLDEVIAPKRSAVNREGTLLRVEGLGGDEEEIKGSVIESVTEMGFFAQHVDRLPEEVSRWYSSAEIEELSAEEARILAERWADELLEEGLSGLPESKLRPALEHLLLSTFRNAAQTGAVQVNPADLREHDLQGVGSTDVERLRTWLIRKLSGGKHLSAE